MGEAKRRSKLLEKIMESLLHLFVIKYVPQCNTRRRYILYFGVTLLTDNINLGIEIVKEDDKIKINNVSNNISNIYKQIKMNEVQNKTGELIKNPSSEEDTTTNKLLVFSMFGDTYIPRI